MFAKVIVGYDGSEQGRDALRLGETLTAHDGEIIVCCVHHYQALSAHIDPTEPSVEQAPAQTLASLLLAAVANDASIPDPTRVDLLVLGSHGPGLLSRLIMGSTSAAVVRSAACPVLVVPPDVKAEDAQRESDAPAGA